uniref:Uncharacterized protein n=1 Tax=Molossus molossus TaxID=27622 RepID=A0A7J8I867_MOLMO|nr:hypothetical protein HJG59_010644 [Molossus molossus]
MLAEGAGWGGGHLQELGEEAIKQQGRPKKDEQRHSIPGPNGGFSGKERGRQRWNVELSELKGGRFPAEDPPAPGTKAATAASLAKPPTPGPFSEATIGKLSSSHRLLDPRGPSPVGLGCPGVAGTQGGQSRGSLGPGL